jgi:hypothetical protein
MEVRSDSQYTGGGEETEAMKIESSPRGEPPKTAAKAVADRVASRKGVEILP